MQRFAGMMPSSDVTIKRTFDTGGGLKVIVEAGPKGWSILYADYSSEYKDVDAPAKDNFDAAMKVLTGHFPSLDVTDRSVKKGLLSKASTSTLDGTRQRRSMKFKRLRFKL
jgi:hypothetical protein